MKMNLLYLLIFFLSSCASYNKIESGTYKATGTDFEYTLKINGSEFELYEKVQGANPTCKGKWKRENDDKILLTCYDDETLSEQLSSNYMVKREHYITLKRRKVIYKNTVLKLQ